MADPLTMQRLENIKTSERRALDELPVPVCVHQEDTIVYGNRAAHECVGLDWTTRAAIGRSIMEFQPPEMAVQIWENRRKIFESGGSVHNVPMVVVDTRKRRWLCLAHGKPVLWGGCPALLVAWVMLGLAELPAPNEVRLQPEAPTAAPDSVAAKAIRKLSERERDVALMLCQGHGTENIAAVLEISPQTVRTHIRNVFRKTDTHSRIELVNALTGLSPAPRVRQSRRR